MEWESGRNKFIYNKLKGLKKMLIVFRGVNLICYPEYTPIKEEIADINIAKIA